MSVATSGSRHFFGPEPVWGPVPFRSAIVDVDALGAPLLSAMWDAWSHVAIGRHPDAQYYAEKLAVPIEPALEAGIPVRLIDLLRDPRDMLASILAFTATGADGFGRRPGQSEDDYVQEFVVRLRERYETMLATPNQADRILVSCEHLVSNLHHAADRLEAWLGVELDADAVLAQQGRVRSPHDQHSVDASVGR